MTEYIHGHGIEKNRDVTPHGKAKEFVCPSEDCHIRSIGVAPWNTFVEMAKEYDCPSGSAECIVCEREIEPMADICRECEHDLEVGKVVNFSNE